MFVILEIGDPRREIHQIKVLTIISKIHRKKEMNTKKHTEEA
jgi:hypothetical protein